MTTSALVAPFLHNSPSTPDVGGWALPVVLVSVTVACYLTGVRRHRARRTVRWSRWRTSSWAAGAAMVGLASSPVAEAAARQPSGHMVQHVVLGMIAPLALVLGAPLRLVLATANPAVGRRISRLLRARPVHVVTHPVAAAVLAVGGMFVLYLTPLYAVSAGNAAVHHAVHLHFVVSGYLFSWSIVGPDPAPDRPGLRTRVLVLVLAAAAHSFLAKLLHARAAELPPEHPHTVVEMEQAAQWMYYGGDLAEVLLATALFASWYRLDGRKRRSGRVGSSPILHFVALQFSTAQFGRDCPHDMVASTRERGPARCRPHGRARERRPPGPPRLVGGDPVPVRSRDSAPPTAEELPRSGL